MRGWWITANESRDEVQFEKNETRRDRRSRSRTHESLLLVLQVLVDLSWVSRSTVRSDRGDESHGVSDMDEREKERGRSEPSPARRGRNEVEFFGTHAFQAGSHNLESDHRIVGTAESEGLGGEFGERAWRKTSETEERRGELDSSRVAFVRTEGRTSENERTRRRDL